MQLLIDTQSILWYQTSDPRLSKSAKELMDDRNNRCFISMVSLWEMAIKVSLNKLTIKNVFEKLPFYFVSHGFIRLDITLDHINTLITLPDHHRDPFDRLLISQAISENLTIISSDQHFSTYPVPVIW